MSKLDARTFQTKVPIGSNILLTLSTNREVEGKLTEIGIEKIELHKKDGENAFYTYDRISGCEILPDVITGKLTPQESITPSTQPKTLIPRTPQVLFQYFEEIANIDSSYRVQTRAGILTIRQPKFLITDDTYNIQTKLELKPSFDRFTNIWQNAHKQNEMNRLEQIIQEWKLLSRNYPNDPTITFNLGCLYLALNKTAEAIRSFYSAKDNEDNSYNLTAAALRSGKRQIACYGLKKFFSIKSPNDYHDMWQLFIGLINENQAVPSLKPIIEKSWDHAKEQIVEAVLFLLKTNGLNEDTQKLATEYYSAPDLLTANQITPFVNKLSGIENIGLLLEVKELAQEKEEDAFEINKLQNKKYFLDEARGYEKDGFLTQALDSVRQVYDFYPSDPEAKLLETILEGRLRRPSYGKPVYAMRPNSIQASGPYKEAKYIIDNKGDLDKAAHLLTKAIQQKDNWESAIKDLAMLRTRQGQNNEAIKLLKENLGAAENPKAIRNLLVMTYQSNGQFDEAIDRLQELLKGATSQEISRIHKQLSFCYLKNGMFDKAEETLQIFLRQSPDDLTAKRWLDDLKQVKSTGGTKGLETFARTLDSFTDFDNPVSEYLQFHIQRNQYEGVKADIVATKSFSLRDVDILSFVANDVGASRPRERSQFFLSAAKILMELKGNETFPIRRQLCKFCASMGDACFTEGRHVDIARGYYHEAFSTAPEWTDQLEVKLKQLVISYYGRAEEVLRAKGALLDCLAKAFELEERSHKVVEELLDLSVANKEAAAFLVDKLYSDTNLRQQVVKSCNKLLNSTGQIILKKDFTELWEKGRKGAVKKHQESVHELRILQYATLNYSILQDHNQRLNDLRDKLRGELDRNRIEKIREILELIDEYKKQTDYGEQERMAALVISRCDGLVQEIETGPTKITLELLYPYVRSLKDFIESIFREVQNAAEPEIAVTLAFDEYTPNDKSKIGCQINLSNSARKSPASSVILTIAPSPTGHYSIPHSIISIPQSLRGGFSVTCDAPIKITDRAKQDLAFTLHCSVTYTTRSNQQVTIPDQRLSVRLYSATEFREIPNPYIPGASGTPIENDQMFVGRDDFIAKLLNNLHSSPINSSLVIYGQKRTGKTSVLIHIQKRLTLPFIPVRLTIGDVIEDIQTAGLPGFLYFLAKGINRQIINLEEKNKESLKISCPPFSEFKERAQSCFDEYLCDLRERFLVSENFREARIVILLDEFTYLYNEIVKGRLPDNFMKAWKAILEKGYFSSIVSGQDFMPKFLKHFPNEFQVAERQRLSYLSENDARHLIENPILIPKTGKSRFRGAAGEAALTQIIYLTAGNPYFLQAFCKHLVELMNDQKKAVYVTDAYVDEVKRQLIRGTKALSEDYFDSLVSSGDQTNEAYTDNQVWQVLTKIAHNSKNLEYCSRSNIEGLGNIPIDQILSDLKERQVIETKPQNSIKIKVGLFKEWLLENK